MSPKAFALLLSLTASVTAQTYTTKKIVFKHPGTFTQSQLEAASGLHAGMKVTGEDIGAAAQKLADSQYFDNVQAAMADTGGLVVTFDLTPAPAAKFQPAGFDNFVWLTPAEITAAIQAKVPLYNGTLTEGSAAVDDASAALKDALAAKGVQARVTCDSFEPSLLHPLRALEFRVTAPDIRVANIKLGGVSPELVPLIQTAVNKIVNTQYSAGLNDFPTADRILAPLADAGYVKAELHDQTAEPGTLTNGTMPVIVHATLNAGSLYHVGAITFAGATLVSADAFGKTLQLKPGDVASQKLLLTSLGPLADAYTSRGYLDVLVKSNPTYEDTTDTVNYAVTVEPGEPYTLHDLQLTGLSDAAQAQFKAGFALHVGDAYNAVYVRQRMMHDPNKRAGPTDPLAFKATAYPATHTVDLVLSFGGNTTVNAR